MHRITRYLVPILLLFGLGCLMGSTCNVSVSGLPNIVVTGYGQNPYGFGFVTGPIYNDPFGHDGD